MTSLISQKRVTPPWSPDGQIFRLCLDLNVWVSAYLADRENHQNTAAQALVEVAERGRCALGPTQIVISWGMLSRLRDVFARKFRLPRPEVDEEIDEITLYTSVGPGKKAPYLLLGGTGVMPLHDDEDAHVLDTAVAGDAHVLATANFDDFVWYRSEIVKPGRIAIHEGPRQPLVIAHPFEVVRWTREGRITFD